MREGERWVKEEHDNSEQMEREGLGYGDEGGGGGKGGVSEESLRRSC